MLNQHAFLNGEKIRKKLMSYEISQGYCRSTTVIRAESLS